MARHRGKVKHGGELVFATIIGIFFIAGVIAALWLVFWEPAGRVVWNIR